MAKTSFLTRLAVLLVVATLARPAMAQAWSEHSDGCVWLNDLLLLTQNPDSIPMPCTWDGLAYVLSGWPDQTLDELGLDVVDPNARAVIDTAFGEGRGYFRATRAYIFARHFEDDPLNLAGQIFDIIYRSATLEPPRDSIYRLYTITQMGLLEGIDARRFLARWQPSLFVLAHFAEIDDVEEVLCFVESDMPQFSVEEIRTSTVYRTCLAARRQ